MVFAGPDPDARPWGLAGGFHRADVPILFGVYVRPAVRGRGSLTPASAPRAAVSTAGTCSGCALVEVRTALGYRCLLLSGAPS